MLPFLAGKIKIASIACLRSFPMNYGRFYLVYCDVIQTWTDHCAMAQVPPPFDEHAQAPPSDT